MPRGALIYTMYFLGKWRPEAESFRSVFAADRVELNSSRICDTRLQNCSRWSSHGIRDLLV